MKRARAYAIVGHELEQWRDLSSDGLMGYVGQSPLVREIEIDREPVSIEVFVSWRDASRTHVRVEAIANGPSTWRLERVVEHLDLPLRNREN